MKNFLNKITHALKIGNIVDGVKQALYHYPVAFISILVFYGLFFIDMNDFYEVDNMYVYFSVFTTFLVSVGLYYFDKKNIWQILALTFGAWVYLVTKDLNPSVDVDNVVIGTLIVFSLSLLFYIPFVLRNNKDINKSFANFIYEIVENIFWTIIIFIPFLLLGLLALESVRELFDISSQTMSHFFDNWFPLVLALLAPLYFLVNIPKDIFNNRRFNENKNKKIHGIVVKYILIPFSFVYFIILYSYSVKLIVNFGDWPKGEVAWMVILFSIFAYITFVFSYFYKDEKRISLIRKFIPWVILPQLLILFYAIILRINQYDWTINRYFVIVFGIWLLILSTYYIVSKKKKIVFIPYSLIVLIVLISWGSWSVYEFPKERQLNKLTIQLENAGILNENVIIPLENKEDLSPELSKELWETVQYLYQAYRSETLVNIFPNISKEVDQEYCDDQEKDEHISREEDWVCNPRDNWNFIGDLFDKINVESDFYRYQDNGESRNIFFTKKNKSHGIYSVTGYDYLLQEYHGDNNRRYSFEKNNDFIKVFDNGNEIFKVNTEVFKKYFEEKYQENKNGTSTIILEGDEFEFVFEEKDRGYKIILDEYQIDNPDYGKEEKDSDIVKKELSMYSVGYWGLVVLIKEK